MVRLEGIKYPMKIRSFASVLGGGYLQVYEIVDHPKVIVTRFQKTRKHNPSQKIEVNGKEFKTVTEAINYTKEQENEQRISRGQRDFN